MRQGNTSASRARLFTVVHLFIGLGVLVAFTAAVARHYIQHRVDVAGQARAHLRAHLGHNQPPEEGGSQDRPSDDGK